MRVVHHSSVGGGCCTVAGGGLRRTGGAGRSFAGLGGTAMGAGLSGAGGGAANRSNCDVLVGLRAGIGYSVYGSRRISSVIRTRTGAPAGTRRVGLRISSRSTMRLPVLAASCAAASPRLRVNP